MKNQQNHPNNKRRFSFFLLFHSCNSCNIRKIGDICYPQIHLEECMYTQKKKVKQKINMKGKIIIPA